MNNNIDIIKLWLQYRDIYFDIEYYKEQLAAAYNAQPGGEQGRTDWTSDDFFKPEEMQRKADEYNSHYREVYQQIEEYNEKMVDGRNNWSSKDFGINEYVEELGENRFDNWTPEDVRNVEAWKHFSTIGYKYKNADETFGINPSSFFDVKRYYNELKIDYTDVDPITYYTTNIAILYNGSDPLTIEMPATPKRVSLGKILIDSRAYSYNDIPKSNDHFTNELQYNIGKGTDWNYHLGLNGEKVLYYSFDFYDDIPLETKEILFSAFDEGDSFTSLDINYHEYCRGALNMITAITGIIFKEEKSDYSRSNIHFCSGKIYKDDTLAFTIHSAVFSFTSSYIVIDERKNTLANNEENMKLFKILHTRLVMLWD